MAVTNTDLVRVLRELQSLTELDDGSPQSFRARAYDKAIHAVEDLSAPAAEMAEADLVAVKGIGKSIARTIRELVDTGTVARLEELRAEYPPAFLELTRIPGLGPKTLKLIRAELGVENLDDLRAALAAEALRDLPGLGAKTEENVARAIERLGLGGKERRTPIATALPIAARVVEAMSSLPGVERARYCGSLRRFAETIGDVDVLVAASARAADVMEAFIGLDLAYQVLAHGTTKSAILTREGLQIDLRVVQPEQWGAATLYFTGSKAHNIALRQRALERGWTLNEYALADQETEAVVASRTEEDVYRALGMSYVPAPLREDAGEIEAAAAGELPDLVTVEALRGDLHDHTTLSGDGRSRLEAIVAAAAERGLEYLAITDHGENLTINGVSRPQMLAERRGLARLEQKRGDIALLHGCELNIAPDGSLDYDDEFLMGFDWCVASVHSHFDLDRETQTRRVITAMRHPAVGAIGHLSGRMIGRRPGIDLDIDTVLEAAVLTGTAIEINGALDRLDASDEVLRRARGSEVVFTISTDSHHVDEFRRLDYGVRHARRGWVEREAVANTWPLERLRAWITAGRDRG